MKLDVRELDLLYTATTERIDSLTRYVGWIIDTPRLPEKTQAINNVNAEIREMRNLGLRLWKEKVDVAAEKVQKAPGDNL